MMRISLIAAMMILLATMAWGDACYDCHVEITPGIVTEFDLSAHAGQGMLCSTCHGSEHMSAADVSEAQIPTYETCGMCHRERLDQFAAGKHSKAWEAMFVMPTAHWQPMELMEGMKGCGGCHKIGFKSEDEIRGMKAADSEESIYGLASCDMCHTRHQFSIDEARAPQTCRTCHMGIDHPQWEMYSSSKHGVRALLKQSGILPETTQAPTCQYCHMPEGNHDVGTAWGFLALRLPMPEDEEWAEDRATILKGLGVLDPGGQPTSRLEALGAIDIIRTSEEDWRLEREKMIGVCTDCHSQRFAASQLAMGDSLIREADALMAEGIEIVASLFADVVIEQPGYYGYPYSDLLLFHDVPTVIETRLFEMYMIHRMRTFQGAFHMNPDYSLWYGWSEMNKDLTEIRELAARMRRDAGVE